MEKKRVGIIGAGISGLVACKHALERGFNPTVFEADTDIGGVWMHTLESTRLQSPRPTYEFSDFPWPADVTEVYPHNTEVREYLRSYARHFDLPRHIIFNAKVVGIEYVGVSEEEIVAWELWAGNGEAFGGGGSGEWHVTVKHGGADASTEVRQITCVRNVAGVFDLSK